jgi:predicted transcriptional regulator
METSDSIKLAAEVVAAFVSNNPLPRSDLPALIPAVPIRKSITPDYLVCLEDGKRFKSLRRHLRLHGLTPEQYREKWNLSSDYPMVAPNYSTERSALAKKIGLGQTQRRAR